MPPEPLPYDRKRSWDSVGSVSRWKESPGRWGGSADFRSRPTPGHGKQGGWHPYSEESGHGFTPSGSRGDGRYSRNGRENRGSYSQKDWRGQTWENGASPNGPGRPLDPSDHRSVDDMLTFGNTWDQPHLKDQHDKTGGVNGLGAGQRFERENSLGSIDWKPLKWARSGSMSSRGSGLSHSSSSKSMGVDSSEAKADAQLRNVTPLQSPSGDAVNCATSAAPSEEGRSKKKPRLGWGEGLAKYEKKKVEGPDESATKHETDVCDRAETLNYHGSSLADKSPGVAGFSDCASPATPSSVGCSSSPGAEDKPLVKAANIDNDNSNLSGSPNLLSQNHLEGVDFNLENLDLTQISNLSSSISELLQTDDPGSVDSSFVRSTGMNKLLVWKGNILKELEVTELEIESLENELKSLVAESGNNCPCPASSSSLLGKCQAKPCEELVATSNLLPRPSPLQLDSSGDVIADMAVGDLEDKHAQVRDEDVDSPGTVTSKFVELLSSTKGAALSDPVTHGKSSGDQDSSKSRNLEMKCSVYSSDEKTRDVSASDAGDQLIESKSFAVPRVGVSSHCDRDSILNDLILASNKDCANRAAEVFSKLLPSDRCHIDISRMSNICSGTSDPLIQERFEKRKYFLRFKERVITLKFRALQHLWKEDVQLLSIRKYRAKSQKRLELILRTPHGSYQKHRSSIRSRFTSPAGNLSIVPTTEIINFTCKLLSDSQVKPYRDLLKMPALILDKKEKLVSRFISSNCLVEDPSAVEKERAMINPWSSDEKEIFMDKLTTFGKDFRKIASFLDHKTTADCIEFYYKNHKSDCFVKTKKKPEFGGQGKSYTANNYLVTSGKRWNRQVNAASLDMLGVASAIAANADDGTENQQKCKARFILGASSDYRAPRGDDGIVERSVSLDRETVAADVLAGICGSLSSEAMSSCVTSSYDPVASLMRRPLTPEVTQNVDDDTCSDESCGEMDSADWTDEEKSIFIQAVSSYGKDFAKISRCVRTRSRDQCKVFFSKARKCLGLDMIRPNPCEEGVLLNDNANGGGSDKEDACVVEHSVVCSESKIGEDTILSDSNVNHCESDPADTTSLLTDLIRSEENNMRGQIDCKDSELLPKYLVTDDLREEGKLVLGVECYSKVENGVDSMSVSQQAHKNAVLPPDTEVEGGEATGEGTSLGEPVSAEEANDHGLCTSGAEGETMAVGRDPTDGLTTKLERQEAASEDNLNEKQEENGDANISGPSDFNCSDQDLHMKVNASDLAADANAPVKFGVCPKQEEEISVELIPKQEPLHISLERDVPLVNGYSAARGPPGSQYVKTLHQDTPSTLDFDKISDKQCVKTANADDYNQHRSGHSQILKGYPVPMLPKKEMNGDISSKNLAFQSLSKVDRGFCSDMYLSQECFLQKCNSSKAQSSAAELPFVPLERKTNHSRAHSWGSSDTTEKPPRNGDVKLFGQILTHPSPQQKQNNSGVHENEEKGVQHPKLSSNNFTQKSTGTNSAVANPYPAIKFDQNHYRGLENVPIRSYGFWDGTRIQTGFSTLPDSAVLLAKYPDAFGSYFASSANMEQQQPLHSVVKSSEHNLNGVSVFSGREMGSSNRVAEYQSYTNRFAVDVKQRQDMLFTEMQRRNGFDPISSMQPPACGVVGINVVGRGGIVVGGACTTGVSDPVAAIKMHYAKTEQFNGIQTPSIIREEESWRGTGDIDR